MPVDAVLLTALAELGVAPPAEADDPKVQRQQALEYDRAVYPRLGLPGPDLPTRDHVVPVEGHPDVLVRLFYPREPEPGTTLPACLFFFGGAWRQGGLHYPSTAAMCALRAAAADVVVAAVSYALAPEDPYPAALEQGYAALEWLVREAGPLGVDPERIALSGQSSGGNLAAALTHLNRDRARHPVALQILEAPALDLTLRHFDRDAMEVTGEQWAGIERVVDQYVPDPRDRLSPTVSPLLADGFDGLPPAFILTAEVDLLRGDGEAYAAALAAAGIPVAALRLVGLHHEGGAYTRVSATARAGQAAVAEALRTLHA
ncbi:alpha/beta hydrolase fold domain-containing protein [Actinomadura sp. LD22]|uniref:Alpha/beta hydrolase fold domain-containing protein n=1 Tax=Actinomadura physcomitrii TaxID=2650748 RepID=A0A6I4MB50_9ACTN|nr:alpha/beta hydrolase fold domain-containing protein [Actinomadura physcomitrii]MWA02883.1 alpha/beta hydrolase fold domain-containing protein [Actinomadura physcomitrii]